jgi:hypothetical protein
MFKFAPYSFSKINTHKQCGRKFKYGYILKAKRDQQDRTALLKGGAVHSIFEKHPDPSTHKLASKYQDIADKFISSRLGQKYLFLDSIREYKFGLGFDLEPCAYKTKNVLFRGFIDHICIVEEETIVEIEVDTLDDVPSEYEIVGK